jgi:Protein of unknown function (DUF3866)
VRFTTGAVTAILSERQGLQRVEVDGRPAYVLTGLIGPVAVGDRVVVNTTAVDRGLGSGGWDVVHWNLARDGWSAPGPGHVMKLRYTSLQLDTGCAEEAAGYAPPPGGLAGTPVVAIALHSQLAPVAAAFKRAAPGRRLVYVMTDAGALPLALSDTVAALVDARVVDATVTAGQAFGGDHEAVNLASALDVARAVAGADAVVAGTGPGVVGTGTARGYSGLEVAAIVDAAARAGGRPIVAVRHSSADPRPRHRGVSHHTRTALEQAHAAAAVPVPAGEPDPGLPGTVTVDVPDLDPGIDGITTMGRTAADDPTFFRYAAAAGAYAAGLLAT